jgi:serine phosphatase RsbU (regulator of sigma subunit)
MMTTTNSRWSFWPWQRKQKDAEAQPAPAPIPLAAHEVLLDWDIAPNDPLLAYFLHASGAVEVNRLHLDSPALRRLKAEGVAVIVPLVSQGELVGIINLGQRRSDQEYSSDDRRLLDDLAVQAAPAVRVAQLVRQQEQAAVERERIESELRVARTIQQTLLPKAVPALDGWEIAAYWQPARAVGGDFYDFLQFPDGRLGLVIADVTDKGVPAALVMATTRTLLRAAAERLISPSEVLERANEVLCPDIPPKMFVTCLYAVLDPATGRLQYANAGHDMPYLRRRTGVEELRARGMPLGLLPGMQYEEKEVMLAPDDTVLFYSDGLVEAHNGERAMFSG